MKSKLYSLIALLGVLFYSCENVVNEPVPTPASASQAIVTVIDTVGDITLDVARYVAESYTKTAQTRNSVTKKIKEIIPVNDEKGVASLYIVNYENNQGYLILSGVNEYQPILAFSERGNFDINRKDDGTSVWLEEQQTLIKNVNVLPDSIRWNNKKVWNEFFEKEVPLQFFARTQTRSIDPALDKEVGIYVQESLNQWRKEGYTIYPYASLPRFFSGSELEAMYQAINSHAEDRYYGGLDGTVFIRAKTITDNTTKNPLLQSQWNQTGGYEVNGYPAGCVAVAMGQIMRYYEYPVLYNWSAMAYNYATNMTVQLLAEIGQKVNMNYTPEGSTASTSAACNAFRQYGYSKANIVNHTGVRTFNELSNNRPIFMRGTNSGTKDGHAWVCDGFKRTITYQMFDIMILDRFSYDRIPPYDRLYDGRTNSTYSTYFHMNWGWGGSKDGYFYEENVNPGGYNFSTSRQDIVDIYPSR